MVIQHIEVQNEFQKEKNKREMIKKIMIKIFPELKINISD